MAKLSWPAELLKPTGRVLLVGAPAKQLPLDNDIQDYATAASFLADESAQAFAAAVYATDLGNLEATATDPLLAKLSALADETALIVFLNQSGSADLPNYRSPAEWRYYLSRYHLLPVKTKAPNVWVVRKAGARAAAVAHRRHALRYKAPKLLQARAIAPHLARLRRGLRDRFPRSLQFGRGRRSYAQQGEDLIMYHLLHNAFGLDNLTYIDIGAHHPYFLSNTALFYQLGWRGINIEPDPNLFQNFVRLRPHDTNLNIGLAARPGVLDFYVLEATTNSSFVKSEIDAYVKLGYRLEETRQIPVDTIDNVIKHYNGGKFPDILSLDVEGMDLEILRSIDFTKYRPLVICVETAQLANHTYVKNEEIINLIKSKGYMIYADTFTNTIFVQADRWQHLF